MAVGKLGARGGTGSLGGLGSQSSPGAFSLVTGIADGADSGGYQQSVQRGNSIFVPSVNSLGQQYVTEISATDGSIINSVQISAAYAGLADDHIMPFPFFSSSGALIISYCGHNTDSVMRFRRASDGTLSGLGTEYTVATAGATTYPQMFQHASTGDLYLIYRSSQTNWAIMKSTNDGVSWTVIGAFVTNAQQMYCLACWAGADTIRLFSNFNQTFDDSIIYIAEFNVVTGALVTGSGTLSNMYTGTPAFPANMSNWSALADPGTGSAAAVLDYDLNGNLLYLIISDDQMYEQIWYAHYNGGGQFGAANWSFTKVADGGYGVGDLASINYRWSGFACMDLGTVSTPRVYMGRQFRGVSYIERWDAANAQGTSWQCSAYFDSKSLGLSDAVRVPKHIVGSSGKIPFVYNSQTYHEYNQWVSTVKYPVISSQGSSYPNLTATSNVSTPEQMALEIALSASEPVGWNIVGGADAALFFVAGNKLYLQSKKYLAPTDANADNVYEVTLRAVTLSGKYRDFPFTVTVTQAAYAPANMLKWSEIYNNAVWANTGLTLTQNTADILDPLGTNLAFKAVQVANNVAHRVQQTVSLTSGQTYTLQSKFHVGTVAYGALNIFDGTTGFGGIFDFQRKRLVTPNSPGGALVSHGMQDEANGWVRAWVTAKVTHTSASSLAQIVLKSTAGSAFSELGNTANSGYFFASQLNTGAFGDYVTRTT